MSAVAVIVPVLNRPQSAAPLADSLAASTTEARLVFVCSPGDLPELRACRKTGCEHLLANWRPGRADWARKLEYARARTDEEFLLLGADDIRFEPGWLEAVLRRFRDDSVGVVGTNDLANPAVKRGLHSTHPVVRRAYADECGSVDDPATVLCLQYWHNFADTELVQTARSRKAWAFAKDARVPHSHPGWHTAPMDATYRRGLKHFGEDRALYQARRVLWEGARGRNGRRRVGARA